MHNRKWIAAAAGSFLVGSLSIGGCSESGYREGRADQTVVQASAGLERSEPAQYLIQLAEGKNIETVIALLQKFDARIVRDLDRGRYLVELGSDPGLEQLVNEFHGSDLIDQIQPNYSYQSQ